MLPKPYRLPAYLIPETLKKGKRFFSSSFNLIIYEPPAASSQQPAQFAFIVPIKIDKRASRRNKIKRQLREIVKTNLSYIKSASSVIFLVRPSIMTKNFSKIKDEAEQVLKKAKLLENSLKKIEISNGRKKIENFNIKTNPSLPKKLFF